MTTHWATYDDTMQPDSVEMERERMKKEKTTYTTEPWLSPPAELDLAYSGPPRPLRSPSWGGDGMFLSPVDYARAGRCVNACQGIKPEAVPDLLAALEEFAAMGGKTLLGPDSKHHMGDDAPCYYEMGANAAFAQVASLASGFIAKAKEQA